MTEIHPRIVIHFSSFFKREKIIFNLPISCEVRQNGGHLKIIFFYLWLRFHLKKNGGQTERKRILQKNKRSTKEKSLKV